MKKILILGGGISKEREISLETTKQVKDILVAPIWLIETGFPYSWWLKI